MLTKPTKCTPALQDQICATLRLGVDVATACRREGVGKSTYYEWRKRGLAGEQPYAGFLEATDQALAQVEVDVTYNIIRASKNRWQAGAWWLKWRATEGVQRIELTGKDGAPIAGTLTPESADLIRERILFGDREPAPRQLQALGASPQSHHEDRDDDELHDDDGVESTL